jgi:membrane peptidoglycan carboxypeptidase
MSIPEGARQRAAGRPGVELRQHRRRRRGRAWLIAALVVVLVIVGIAGLAAVAYSELPLPSSSALPERTIVYYADGKTPMAYLGTDDRRVVSEDQMSDVVTQAAVAAGDQAFWSDSDSPITRSVVRAMEPSLVGSGITTRARAYATARRFEAKYSKRDILGFYLNLFGYGRGAVGVEAAAQSYFHRTVIRTAPADQQVTPAQAIALAAMLGRADPDPTASPAAAADARSEFDAIRQTMVALHYLDATAAAQLSYPADVSPPSTVDSNGATGLIVQHVLAELRQSPQFKDKPPGFIENGGFDIITTVDPRAQTAVQAAADPNQALSVLRGQPSTLADAAVMVQPGTGRVLAYYGNNIAGGADYAGWYYGADGLPVGYGAHAAGQTFAVYDMAAALKQGDSLQSRWSSPTGSKAFPAGPVVERGRAQCQPRCTLLQAANGSLVIPFFDLTLSLGAGSVLDLAQAAGLDDMWSQNGTGLTRQHLVGTGVVQKLTPQPFGVGLGIGQYPVTVLDQANVMATFAASGQRATVHFVQSVQQDGKPVYSEKFSRASIGLTPGQIGDLSRALSSGPLGQLGKIESASQSGAAQYTTAGRPSDAWMVGYSSSLAMAVWIGDRAGGPITVTGNALPESVPAAIYRAAMTQAHSSMGLAPKPFPAPGNTGAISPPGSI